MINVSVRNVSNLTGNSPDTKSETILDSTGRQEHQIFSNYGHHNEKSNIIWRIKDAQGNWFDDQERISRLITSEFQKRVKAEVKTNQLQDIPLSKEIAEADKKLLKMEVSDEEIYKVKQIHTSESSRSKWYASYFYQKSWNIIGNSVCNMVRSFFYSGHMLKEINRT